MLERISELPKNLHDGVPGKPKADVKAIGQRMQARRSLLPLVQAYQRRKREQEVLDFGDQVALAAQLAREVPEVGRASGSATGWCCWTSTRTPAMPRWCCCNPCSAAVIRWWRWAIRISRSTPGGELRPATCNGSGATFRGPTAGRPDSPALHQLAQRPRHSERRQPAGGAAASAAAMGRSGAARRRPGPGGPAGGWARAGPAGMACDGGRRSPGGRRDRRTCLAAAPIRRFAAVDRRAVPGQVAVSAGRGRAADQGPAGGGDRGWAACCTCPRSPTCGPRSKWCTTRPGVTR